MRKRRIKRHKKGVDPFLVIFFPFVILVAIILYGKYITAPIILWSGILILVVGVVSFAILLLRRYFRRMEQEEDRRQEIYVDMLEKIPPLEFEKIVGWLFERMGYAVSFTPRTGDHGIDLILKKDGTETVAQVKRYKSGHKVSEKELREFYGSMHKEKFERGFFVTNGKFTDPAQEWAKALSIELINGQGFVRRVKELDEASWQKIIVSKTLQ